MEAFIMSMPGLPELLIIFFIVLIIFGAGKIPKIAKDIGSGIKEFKKAMNSDDDTRDEKKS
ncbi:MAG: twin-arginine translocase TatA/TatE family subunit [Spirochaetota bacterium]|jgi:sec-independent protein translocase protein TatA